MLICHKGIDFFQSALVHMLKVCEGGKISAAISFSVRNYEPFLHCHESNENMSRDPWP